MHRPQSRPLPNSLDLPFNADEVDDDIPFDWEPGAESDSGDSGVEEPIESTTSHANTSNGKDKMHHAFLQEREGSSLWEPLHADAPQVELYRLDDLRALCTARETMKDRDDQDCMHRLVKQLTSRGPRRDLVTLPTDWESRLDDLERTMPNFGEVIEVLRSALIMRAFGNHTVHFDPLLIAGQPGVGKTMFCERLAQLLGLPLSVVRLADAQSNASLSGSEQHWSNAKPGVLFDALVYGKHGNPLFFIDELDKADNASRGCDPTSALLSLLEPGTARSFTDLCFPKLRIDASHVCFLAAANDLTRISEPIQSRFRIVEVPLPTPEQALQIAAMLVSTLVRECLKGQMTMHFTEAALTPLCVEPPRRIRILGKEAIGRALRARRNVVYAEDIRTEPTAARSIGFV
ncbi:AAA family ATPase [Noviherbaspirillum malthae]|uniref:AAA family ATPase n=1 Tax=Noviherbaspirillum malthae TaxID=1260987 RepID=UPI00188EF4A3|nr:AAA family ATPase [Noviherbaspirillum malthae]